MLVISGAIIGEDMRSEIEAWIADSLESMPKTAGLARDELIGNFNLMFSEFLAEARALAGVSE